MTTPSLLPTAAVALGFTAVAALAWAYDDPHAASIGLGAVFAGFATLALWAFKQLTSKD